MCADQTWGVVTSVASPAEVRIVGDSVDMPCPKINDNIASLATTDVVLVERIGGSWAIVAVLVDS